MKIQLNEIKRMQQLAGLITESQLNENNFFGFSYKNKNKDVDTKKLMAMDEKEAFQIARKWMEKNNLDPNEIQSMKQLDQYEIEKYDEITESQLNEALSKTYKVIKTAKEGNSHLMDGRWKVGDMLALQQEGNDYKLSTKDDIEQTYDGQSLESLIRDKFIEPVNINEVAGLEQYKTGMKLQLKGKPDQTFTIQMVQPSTVKGMEAAMALHLKDDKTGKEFRDSPGGYEIIKITESINIEQAVNEALKAYRKKK